MSPSVPITARQRDPEFYKEDDMSFFAVEDYIFKIPRFFLDRETSFFAKDTLRSAQSNSAASAASNSMPPAFPNKYYDPIALSLPQWLAILSASTHFDMASVRARAINELTALSTAIDPVEQIVIALKHKIPAWLTDAYVTLCERKKSLTSQEAKTLGTDIACMVAEAREAAITATFACTCDSSSTPRKSMSDVSRCAVDEVFGREQRELKNLNEKIAKEQASAKKEVERVRAKKEKEELEKKRRLKDAQAAKEKAEKLIKEMEVQEKASPEVRQQPGAKDGLPSDPVAATASPKSRQSKASKPS
ncbi:hypothetical protein FIBSPDRAFT_1047105 [Athelia psychrophila]|uniref:Uncharacterized protein n=1 Tax=Athelia psychrophila TaxID=1759441 RepID=A0A166FN26_9AGAM|nr:hypothetical protein FIBSPDRAFT_1047105 [Fibularhizoctonia sp. CBS 109695]